MKIPLQLGDAMEVGNLAEGGIAFVADGTVILQRVLNDGRRFVADFVYPGEPLNLCQSGQHMSALAATTSTICVLSQELVSTLTRAYPQVAVQLSNMAMEGRGDGLEHMTILARADVQERIVFALYRLAARCGQEGPKGVEVDLPMTRSDLADYLGLNTETVSRQFSKLKKMGLIELPKPDKMIVPDIDALREKVPLRSDAAISAGCAQASA